MGTSYDPTNCKTAPDNYHAENLTEDGPHICSVSDFQLPMRRLLAELGLEWGELLSGCRSRHSGKAGAFFVMVTKGEIECFFLVSIMRQAQR